MVPKASFGMASPKLKFVVRPGVPDDRKTLMAFYKENVSDTLPTPSYDGLTSALENESLLVIVDLQNQPVACAGYFQYSHTKGAHYLYELSGTRVTKRVGGLQPFPLQKILIAIRLFQLMVSEGRDGSPVSVISSAISDKSIENLKHMAFEELRRMPAWIEFDTYSYMRASERSKWRNFLAGEKAAVAAIYVLEQINFGAGEFTSYRYVRNDLGEVQYDENKQALRQDISIEFDLGLTAIFADVVRARDAGQTLCNFQPIPSLE